MYLILQEIQRLDQHCKVVFLTQNRSSRMSNGALHVGTHLLSGKQEHAIRALSFIDAVVYQQTHIDHVEKPFDASITHSILDCVPGLLIAPLPRLKQRHLKVRAARLFLGLMSASRIRIAVKVAQVMPVSHNCMCQRAMWLDF